jgi:DNA-binding MarR family transcriptional regulator
VRLTAEGRRTIEALFAEHERDMERAVNGLSRGERVELLELLHRLGQSAERQDPAVSGSK